MDERTDEQKAYDSALRSERRTIGHRMSRKVLVISPTNVEAQQWAHSHGIAYSDTVVCTPATFPRGLNGVGSGIEHVILGWYRLPDDMRAGIRHRLVAIQSVPFEGEAVDELCGADPVRS